MIPSWGNDPSTGCLKGVSLYDYMGSNGSTLNTDSCRRSCMFASPDSDMSYFTKTYFKWLLPKLLLKTSFEAELQSLHLRTLLHVQYLQCWLLWRASRNGPVLLGLLGQPVSHPLSAKRKPCYTWIHFCTHPSIFYSLSHNPVQGRGDLEPMDGSLVHHRSHSIFTHTFLPKGN